MISQKQRLKLALLIDQYAHAAVDMIATRNSKESIARYLEVKNKLADYLERMTKS